MMGNVADWPLSWFAIGKAGAVAVPVNARYQEADLGFVLADSAAVMVLATDKHAGLVRAVAAATGTVREVLTPAQLASELAAAGASGPVVPLETFPMTPSARIQKTKLLEQARDQRTGVFDAAANTWV
jgi:acyl-CoA synthetase (AMP-forming)/AMP-acid ligase II